MINNDQKEVELSFKNAGEAKQYLRDTNKDQDFRLNVLLSPCSADFIEDPVIIAGENQAIYERWEIESILKKPNPTSPLTRNPITADDIVSIKRIYDEALIGIALILAKEEQIQKRVWDLSNRERELNVRVDILSQNEDRLNNRINQLSQNENRLNAIIDQLSGEKGTLEDRIKTLQITLKSKTAHISKLENDLALMSKEKEVLEKAEEQAQQRARDAIDRYELLVKEQKETSKEIAGYKKEIAENQKKTKASQALIDKQAYTIKTQAVEIGKLKTENTNLRNKLAEKASDNIGSIYDPKQGQLFNYHFETRANKANFMTRRRRSWYFPAGATTILHHLKEDPITSAAITYNQFKDQNGIGVYDAFKLDDEYRIAYYTSIEIHTRVVYAMHRFNTHYKTFENTKVALINDAILGNFSSIISKNDAGLMEVALRYHYIKAKGLLPTQQDLADYVKDNNIQSDVVSKNFDEDMDLGNQKQDYQLGKPNIDDKFVMSTNDYINQLAVNYPNKHKMFITALIDLSSTSLTRASKQLMRGEEDLDMCIIRKNIKQNRGYVDYCYKRNLNTATCSQQQNGGKHA